MSFFSLIAALAIQSAPSASEPDQLGGYERGWKTRRLAFDPSDYFGLKSRLPLFMTIRYTGDDYGFPVYSLAVRKGCVSDDKGDARTNCGDRMVARMVRSPKPNNAKEPFRPRWRGVALFGYLGNYQPKNDEDLKTALDQYGLEWFEAEVNSCAPAIAHLETSDTIKFFNSSPIPSKDDFHLVFHADKITFEYGNYINRSRYYGWLKPESAGEWANDFAKSLETCWKPASATKPWMQDKPINWDPEVEPIL